MDCCYFRKSLFVSKKYCNGVLSISLHTEVVLPENILKDFVLPVNQNV